MDVTRQFCYWMVRNCSFPVGKSGKSALFKGYINVKKGHSVVLFIFYSERYDRNLSNYENV